MNSNPFPSDTIAEQTTELCYHCGEVCEENPIRDSGKSFCCQGCHQVFQILSENQLCEYYELNSNAGINRKRNIERERYSYLELAEVQGQLLDFTDGVYARVTLHVPQIHCSSCVWLLENLHKINKGILNARLNFSKKQLAITFSIQKISLAEIVSLLAELGYEPHITLETQQEKTNVNTHLQKRLIAQIAVAGFCFGNMMLISFPEYFGFDSVSEETFKYVFQGLNILLSLPVLLYSGQDYLISAYRNVKKGIFNIDFPLALGMVALFGRSIWEIATNTGAGYMDTLGGLIFFLLTGKWFQQKTYDTLRYDRDFKSYFPIAITKKTKEGNELPTQVADLQKDDVIVVRHQELIPADSILIEGDAQIDYSFVTGEAVPVHVEVGSKIFAGGRQTSGSITLQVQKPVSQSYLTTLWNEEAFKKNKEEKFTPLQTVTSRYFTIGLLAIAIGSLLFWGIQQDWTRGFNALTATLIIACPCALALSSPFALGTALRVLGKHQFYLKNTQVIEQLAKVDTLVFDKTGTITETDAAEIVFEGKNLSQEEIKTIYSITKNSTHPLSQLITTWLKTQTQTTPNKHLQTYREIAGKGIQAIVEGEVWRIGSAKFVGIFHQAENTPTTTTVFVQRGNETLGHFNMNNRYRQGIQAMLQDINRQHYETYLLSGDNDSEATRLAEFFKEKRQMLFKQTPTDKLEFIKKLQKRKQNVAMFGDGLNDAGALQQSNVGIAVTDNSAYFTPASDAILEGSQVKNIPQFLAFCKNAVKVVKYSFVISLLYNAVGLSFAVQGTLSPVIAAILMPISSVTIIAFTTITVSSKKI
jgi:Cu+-exporting ATPase